LLDSVTERDGPGARPFLLSCAVGLSRSGRDNEMPKVKTWRNPNKQDLTTGHKRFDRQLTAISSGQVLGGTQTSFCVRPYDETVGPMGQAFEPGALRAHDLGHFRDMPWYVLAYVKSATKGPGEDLLIHEFFTYRADRGRTIIGYILVRYKATTPTILAAFCTTGRASGYRVLDAVAPYLVDLGEGEEVPYMYRDRWR
jgi:hypothetical protein